MDSDSPAPLVALLGPHVVKRAHRAHRGESFRAPAAVGTRSTSVCSFLSHKRFRQECVWEDEPTVLLKSVSSHERLAFPGPCRPVSCSAERARIVMVSPTFGTMR